MNEGAPNPMSDNDATFINNPIDPDSPLEETQA